MSLRTLRRTIARNKMKEAGVQNPGAKMQGSWKQYDPAKKQKGRK